jgi:hypothetical protein
MGEIRVRSGRDDKVEGGGQPLHEWRVDGQSKKLTWTSLTLSRPLRRAQGRLFGTDRHRPEPDLSSSKCCTDRPIEKRLTISAASSAGRQMTFHADHDKQWLQEPLLPPRCRRRIDSTIGIGHPSSLPARAFQRAPSAPQNHRPAMFPHRYPDRRRELASAEPNDQSPPRPRPSTLESGKKN